MDRTHMCPVHSQNLSDIFFTAPDRVSYLPRPQIEAVTQIWALGASENLKTCLCASNIFRIFRATVAASFVLGLDDFGEVLEVFRRA